MKKKFSKTPLDLGKADFKVAVSRTLSCNTRKIIGIIGDAAVGKSTLVTSLQGESSSQSDKAFNQSGRVDDRPKPTAGIDTVPHPSLKTWINSAASSRRFHSRVQLHPHTLQPLRPVPDQVILQCSSSADAGCL